MASDKEKNKKNGAEITNGKIHKLFIEIKIPIRVNIKNSSNNK